MHVHPTAAAVGHLSCGNVLGPLVEMECVHPTKYTNAAVHKRWCLTLVNGGRKNGEICVERDWYESL